MTNYCYTFIIPHRNIPKLLNRCLDSIPVRDDVQVIVVDDNSDDDRVPVIDRKNTELVSLDAEHAKGAGRARNIGIEKAKGKWLLFADADDYYTDYLPVLLDKYAEDDITDIVYLNACLFNDKGKVSPFRSDGLIKNYLSNGKDAELYLRYNLWTPWSRMVKKAIIDEHHLRFDEIPVCNDKMFCLLCSSCSKKIAAEGTVLYMYYKPNCGSQTDKMRNNSALDSLLDIRRRTIALYKKVGYKPIPSILELLFFSEYSRGLPLATVIKKYWKCLNMSNVLLVADLYRFACPMVKRGWGKMRKR